MNKQQFEDKVRLIISEQCGVELCDVKMDSHLKNDFGVDDLLWYLEMTLDDEFSIAIEFGENCGYLVDNICQHLAEKLGYSFYQPDMSQKASQDAPEEFYMTNTSKRTSLPQNVPVVHIEASEEDINTLDEMENVFTKIKSFAEENNLLLSFEPSGKVILIQQDDEFIVENYSQAKQVVKALKVLDSFRC